MNPDLRPDKIIVPMVSPFNSDHSIDEASVARICNRFIKSGVSVFVFGTTGEGDSMSSEQKDNMLNLVVQEVKGKLKIYAGLTGNSLLASIADAAKYCEMGAEFLVTRAPSYFPMEDVQMLEYFEKLADSVKLPLYIYNIPQTTHHSIPLNVIEKLSYHPNIYGLKDSERNPGRLDDSIQLWGTRKDFEFLIGCAAMGTYGLWKGAKGIVPSLGNLFPDLYVQMINYLREGNREKAELCQAKADRISDLYQKNMTLSQSIPALKTMMKMKGLCSGEVLLPMHTMTLQEEEAYLSGIKNEWEVLDL